MSQCAENVEGALLQVERQPGIWQLQLNRPEKRNALSAALVEALIREVDAAQAHHVRVLVFRGAGKNFSAGFDFTDYDAASEGDLVLRFIRLETLLQKVAQCSALTVGLAHGKNFGAGVDLFAACKHRVCAPEAAFRMPGLKFGLVLGTRRFAALVGREAASSVLGSTRTFDAHEAAALGFVHQIGDQSAWQAGIETAIQTAATLDDATRATLYRVLDDANYDADMAELVRSASRPGLKERLRAYLQP